MRTIRLLVITALIFLPVASFGGERFDGNWLTKLTCPAKGNTEGYTWQFVSVIKNGNLHGERGTADQPGYFTIDGTVADDSNAKLTANGIVVSRDYARGVFRTQRRELQLRRQSSIQRDDGIGHEKSGSRCRGTPLHVRFHEAAGRGIFTRGGHAIEGPALGKSG